MLSTYQDSAVWWLIVLSVILIGVVGWNIGKNIAAVADTDPAKPNPDGAGKLFLGVLGPLIIIAFLATACLPTVTQDVPNLFSSFLATPWLRPVANLPAWMRSILTIGLLFLFAWGVAMGSAKRAFYSGWLATDNPVVWTNRWTRIVCWGGASAAILGPAFYGIGNVLDDLDYNNMKILLGPPLVLLSVLLTEILHIGLASHDFKSQQREWLSRLGAWMLILCLGWLAFTGVVLLGPFVVLIAPDYLEGVIASGWVATMVAGLIAGRGGAERQEPGLVRKTLVTISPYVFIAGLGVIVAAGVQSGLQASLNARLDNLFDDPTELLIKMPKRVIPDPHHEISGTLSPKHCDLRWFSVSDDREKQKMEKEFKVEFASKKKECAVLILHSLIAPDRCTISGFDDKGFFKSVSLDDPSSTVLLESNKRPSNERMLAKLITSRLGRTLPKKSGFQVDLALDETNAPESLERLWRSYQEVMAQTDEPWILLLALGVFIFLCYLFSRNFDINAFSLHNMYENRLTRCYLGATTGCRFPNPFTGFSLQDDMPLWIRKKERSGSHGVKYNLGLSEQELKENVSAIFTMCDLRMKLASDDNEKKEFSEGFRTEFEAKKKECAVLIVHHDETPTKWTIFGFNDKEYFTEKLINDPDDKLFKKLKKWPLNKEEIAKLATRRLDHKQSIKPKAKENARHKKLK